MWRRDHRNGRKARSSVESSCIENTKLEKRRREEAKREEVKEKTTKQPLRQRQLVKPDPKLVRWPVCQPAPSQIKIKNTQGNAKADKNNILTRPAGRSLSENRDPILKFPWYFVRYRSTYKYTWSTTGSEASKSLLSANPPLSDSQTVFNLDVLFA